MVFADRVKETTSTTGTGTYTLSDVAAVGFQSFSAALTDADQVSYCVTDGTDWEVGAGTYTATGTTLSRDSITSSSNSGTAVIWSAGDKDIFITASASTFNGAATASEVVALAIALG